MASLDEAFKFSLMANTAKWTNQFNNTQQKPHVTLQEAASIIANQHRFPVSLLKAKTPADIDGCYHFLNIKNGYDYCYKYTVDS